MNDMVSKPLVDQDGNECGKMMLLPAKEGTCPICAREHEPELPHDASSLFYQTRFNMEHGRAATWTDAMEHCAAEVRIGWSIQLEMMGIDWEAGEIYPPRP